MIGGQKAAILFLKKGEKEEFDWKGKHLVISLNERNDQSDKNKEGEIRLMQEKEQSDWMRSKSDCPQRKVQFLLSKFIMDSLEYHDLHQCQWL